jgi:dTDP-4-dehydrorhamnose reductase
MKILLLGCNGQVGWELQRALEPLGQVVAVDRHSCGHAGGVPLHADFARPSSLPALVDAVAPQVIVNAAAHTAVDKAEAEPDLVHTNNATAPGVFAYDAAKRDAWLVHYSTDYVFDGSGTAPWREDSPTGPLSVYGCAKLVGDELIRASGCRYMILRTSWVYAARGGKFAKTGQRPAAERDHLRVIDDQIGARTGAELLADVTAHALRAAQQRPEDVQAVPTSAYLTPAHRPLNSRLNTTKLQRTFGRRLPPWQAGAHRMLMEIHGR